MKYLMMTILLLTSLPCDAGIYMQKNSDGDVTYSDMPLNNATPVSLSSGNTVPSTTSAPSTNTTQTSNGAQPVSAEETELSPYNVFAITSPTNGETIQNQPVITLKLATDPELRAGDSIQVYLDGKAWGQPVASTTIAMTNIDRGEHSLYAVLLDKNQKMLKQSDTIKLFIHRASSNFKTSMTGNTRLAELILN